MRLLRTRAARTLGALFVAQGGIACTLPDYALVEGGTGAATTSSSPATTTGPGGGTGASGGGGAGAAGAGGAGCDAAPDAYAAAVLADAPVSYWRLGEAAGTVARDARCAVDGEYAGAVLGEASLVVAADSAAGFFEPAAGARFGDTYGFEGVTSFTVEAWIRWDGGYGDVVSKRPTAATTRAGPSP